MADFEYSDDAELRKLGRDVLQDPEDTDNWDKLIRAAESQEGGLNRNSNPQAIDATRHAYDAMLARFPLFFGYWRKYAEFEFNIGGPEAAEMVYERGVASIPASPDLWASYCGFKAEVCHDPSTLRELFERALEIVGLDFTSTVLWDKYLEYEQRMDSLDGIYAILNRIYRVPTYHYGQYFEKFRTLASRMPVDKLLPKEVVTQFSADIQRDPVISGKSADEQQRVLRERMDGYYLQAHYATRDATLQRWPFESEIKVSYYLLSELDDAQLVNWAKYLDFEEAQGDYKRIKCLYERCLVCCAHYDAFWFRYARWMLTQADAAGTPDKVEEMRSVFQRASVCYSPIIRPNIRLYYAAFEEMQGRSDVATEILEATLDRFPGHKETILALANLRRRQNGFEAAAETLQKHISDYAVTSDTRGALVAELARLAWKVKGHVEDSRKIFDAHARSCADSLIFWATWLNFEIDQPTTEAQEPEKGEKIKEVLSQLRTKGALSFEGVNEITAKYLEYLQERGGKGAMKEFVELDRQLNGSPIVGGPGSPQRPAVGNGHADVSVAAAASGQPTNSQTPATY